jgi:hypothetical protein
LALLVLLLLFLRRRRLHRPLLALLMLFLFLSHRHGRRRLPLTFPVLLLLAVLFRLRRGRALGRSTLFALLALLLLLTLLCRRRRRLGRFPRAFLVRRCRGALLILLPLAERFRLLQTLRILLCLFQDLRKLLRRLQCPPDRGPRARRWAGGSQGRALCLSEQQDLLAHTFQRAFDQRRRLVRPYLGHLDQGTPRLLPHPLHSTLWDRLAAICQLVDLVSPLCGKIDIEFCSHTFLACQSHSRIFCSQLDRVKPRAGQAVCCDKRRATTDTSYSHHHRQHGGKHFVC